MRDGKTKHFVAHITHEMGMRLRMIMSGLVQLGRYRIQPVAVFRRNLMQDPFLREHIQRSIERHLVQRGIGKRRRDVLMRHGSGRLQQLIQNLNPYRGHFQIMLVKDVGDVRFHLQMYGLQNSFATELH